MWITVIVALLVGGLVGYLIGWNLGPTETKTVTETVTGTVAPPAYTASDAVEAVVTFDGTACMYNGPAEMNAPTRVTFTYAASVAGSSLIVWQVEPGITYEQVAREGVVTEPPDWMVYAEQSRPVDAREQSLSMSLVQGTYVVSCTTNPETSTGEVITSTMLRVVPA